MVGFFDAGTGDVMRCTLEEDIPTKDWQEQAKHSELPCEICGCEAEYVVNLSRQEHMVLCEGCFDCTQFGGPVRITPVKASGPQFIK